MKVGHTAQFVSKLYHKKFLFNHFCVKKVVHILIEIFFLMNDSFSKYVCVDMKCLEPTKRLPNRYLRMPKTKESVKGFETVYTKAQWDCCLISIFSLGNDFFAIHISSWI